MAHGGLSGIGNQLKIEILKEGKAKKTKAKNVG
jgi:hypothetical protein